MIADEGLSTAEAFGRLICGAGSKFVYRKLKPERISDEVRPGWRYDAGSLNRARDRRETIRRRRRSIVPAGGPLQTRVAPHQRLVLAWQVRREFAARSLDLCRYRHGAHGLAIPEGATYEEIVARFEARIMP
jgi:hypothetical protein